ncbi:hypothetical protein NX059_005683 [Plenodomus lindquistii]|nr:hypothetical protein NX059_005683 [Plenodomus lindquistii]
MSFSILSRAAIAVGLLTSTVSAKFDSNSNRNVAVYWGQGSDQIPLSQVCADPGIDIVNIGFVNVFPKARNEYPGTNHANACQADYYPDPKTGKPSQLLRTCPGVEQSIKDCQASGKKVMLSIGGGYPVNYTLPTADVANWFAEFLIGAYGPVTNAWAGKPRPFGTAVVDGFDLDLEAEEWATGTADLLYKNYDVFAKYVKGNSKMLLSAAPQCVVPDVRIAPALMAVQFDFIFAQFYNTYDCSAMKGYTDLKASNGKLTSTTFTFQAWLDWLAATPVNKKTKLYLGLPAGPDGLPTHKDHYLNPTQADYLINKYKDLPNFGGVMLWEASVSVRNVDLCQSFGYWTKTSLEGNFAKKHTQAACAVSSSAVVSSSTKASSSKIALSTLASSTKITSSSKLFSSTKASSSSKLSSSTKISSSVLASSTKASSSPAAPSARVSSSSIASSTKPSSSLKASSSVYSASSIQVSPSSVAPSSKLSSSLKTSSSMYVASSTNASSTMYSTSGIQASSSIHVLPSSKASSVYEANSTIVRPSVYTPSGATSSSNLVSSTVGNSSIYPTASASASSVYIDSSSVYPSGSASVVYPGSYPTGIASASYFSEHSVQYESTSEAGLSTSCSTSSKVYPTTSSSVSHPYPAESSSVAYSYPAQISKGQDVYPSESFKNYPAYVASSTAKDHDNVPSITKGPEEYSSFPSGTTTSVVTTSYVDVCPTGFTTVITVITKTFCGKCAQSTKEAKYPEGWTTSVYVDETVTITLTKPINAPTDVPAYPTAISSAYPADYPVASKSVAPVQKEEYPDVPGNPTSTTSTKSVGYPAAPKAAEYSAQAGVPEHPNRPIEEVSSTIISTLVQHVTLKVVIPTAYVPAPYPTAPAPTMHGPVGTASGTGAYAPLPTGNGERTKPSVYSPPEFEGAASRFGVGVTALVAVVAGFFRL